MFDIRLLFSVSNVTLSCTLCASKCDVDSRRRDVIENERHGNARPSNKLQFLNLLHVLHVYIQPASMYNPICHERIVAHPSYIR